MGARRGGGGLTAPQAEPEHPGSRRASPQTPPHLRTPTGLVNQSFSVSRSHGGDLSQESGHHPESNNSLLIYLFVLTLEKTPYIALGDRPVKSSQVRANSRSLSVSWLVLLWHHRRMSP